MSGSVDLVAGVDLGTSDTKAVLTHLDGVTVAFARTPTTWSKTAEGRAETTGRSLVADTLGALADAVAQAERILGARVRIIALGIAGLGESGVILDARGEETSPVIAWYDERGAAEFQALHPDFIAEFPRRTGLPVGSQWSLPKLLWMRQAGIRLDHSSRWLNVPEFVAYALCGEQVGEPSLASRTGLLDQSTGRPWAAALSELNVSANFLPEARTAGQPAGQVRSCPAVPAIEGAVVTVAGHDHPVAAIGAGAAGPEDLFDSCGTAEVLLRSVPRALTDDERGALVSLGIDAGRHVLADHSVLIGGMRSGLVMRRVLSLIGANEDSRRDELDQRWSPPESASESVQVIGAAIHDNDVTLRIVDGASPDLAWSATLAHLGEQTSALLAGINAVVGEHRSAVAAGGWTRMRSVRESKTASIPRLRICPVEQPGTRGAALFAACAVSGAPVARLAEQYLLTAESTRYDGAAQPTYDDRLDGEPPVPNGVPADNQDFRPVHG
jgi:sugar (pentulose or hexulose) kinase